MCDVHIRLVEASDEEEAKRAAFYEYDDPRDVSGRVDVAVSPCIRASR